MPELRVAHSIEELRAIQPRSTAVTLGVFDGVHRGHRRILEELVSLKSNGRVEGAFVLTFDPHPLVVTGSREAPPLLSTIPERLELFSSFPLDGVFVLRFDDAIARVNYRDFIEQYFLGAMDMRHLVIGYDCHIGHRREGTPERVAEEGERRGFPVTIVPAVEVAGEVVSSTQIRRTLQEADLARANLLLGHPYLVRGNVVPGQGRGRDLGFPTANVAVEHAQKLWPPRGVYAVRVRWREWTLEGMMNVGRSPTIKKGEHDEMEVHIFDFDHAIYGDEVSIYCEAYLRPERAFPTVDALIDQLNDDRRTARERLGVG